jgi:hypothetical protein
LANKKNIAKGKCMMFQRPSYRSLHGNPQLLKSGDKNGNTFGDLSLPENRMKTRTEIAKGSQEMNKESFLAWLEAEGSISVGCHPKNSHYCPRVSITQGDVEVLKKIRNWLGFGRIIERNEKARSFLFFESPDERKKLISLLDSIDESEWLTDKREKYQIWKKIHYYLESKAYKHWDEKSLSKLLDLRNRLLVNPEKRKSGKRILTEFRKHRTLYKKRVARKRAIKQLGKKGWGARRISRAIDAPMRTVARYLKEMKQEEFKQRTEYDEKTALTKDF